MKKTEKEHIDKAIALKHILKEKLNIFKIKLFH